MGGVGPAGSFVASLSPERQAELRELCRARLPPAPFIADRAWPGPRAVSPRATPQPFGWTSARTFRLGSMNHAAHE